MQDTSTVSDDRGMTVWATSGGSSSFSRLSVSVMYRDLPLANQHLTFASVPFDMLALRAESLDKACVLPMASCSHVVFWSSATGRRNVSRFTGVNAKWVEV